MTVDSLLLLPWTMADRDANGGSGTITCPCCCLPEMEIATTRLEDGGATTGCCCFLMALSEKLRDNIDLYRGREEEDEEENMSYRRWRRIDGDGIGRGDNRLEKERYGYVVDD